MRCINIIAFFLLLCNSVQPQNLIPNSSFEATTNLDYMDPASAFPTLDLWYAANGYPNDTSMGTPDLFDTNNPWPSSDPPNFWNIARKSFDGDYHVGIANHLKFEGFSVPEAVGIELIQPLEPGAFYHIGLHARNKGVTGYLDHTPILCVPEQYKQIELLLDADSVIVTIDNLSKDSYSNASKVISLHASLLESQFVRNWSEFGSCFQADGGEKYFGITTTTGRFTVDPPCVIYDEHWDVFYIYYFDIDDVRLTRLPETLELDTTICAGRNTKINIASLADLPVMQNDIEYSWDDGRIDSVNYISEGGTYTIDAQIDCKTIPITLHVTEVNCDPLIYVPNAFSPNGDGTNDQLDVFITVESPIVKYQFSVFDRWGSLVFSANEINSTWDGSFRAEQMGEAVYVWQLEFTVDDHELGLTDYREYGEVMVVR